MKYYKIVDNGYVVAIGTGVDGVEITVEEYASILKIVQDKPASEIGKDFRLKEDLTWELVEVPVIDPTDDEISGNELLSMIEEVL